MHTHTYIHIYSYVYAYVCLVCGCMYQEKAIQHPRVAIRAKGSADEGARLGRPLPHAGGRSIPNGSQPSSASVETRVRAVMVPGSDQAESSWPLAGKVVASVDETAIGDPIDCIAMPETSVRRSAGGRAAVSGDVSSARGVDAVNVAAACARSRSTTVRSNASRVPASIERPRLDINFRANFSLISKHGLDNATTGTVWGQ